MAMEYLAVQLRKGNPTPEDLALADLLDQRRALGDIPFPEPHTPMPAIITQPFDEHTLLMSLHSPEAEILLKSSYDITEEIAHKVELLDLISRRLRPYVNYFQNHVPSPSPMDRLKHTYSWKEKSNQNDDVFTYQVNFKPGSRLLNEAVMEISNPHRKLDSAYKQFAPRIRIVFGQNNAVELIELSWQQDNPDEITRLKGNPLHRLTDETIGLEHESPQCVRRVAIVLDPQVELRFNTSYRWYVGNDGKLEALYRFAASENRFDLLPGSTTALDKKYKDADNQRRRKSERKQIDQTLEIGVFESVLQDILSLFPFVDALAAMSQ